MSVCFASKSAIVVTCGGATGGATGGASGVTYDRAINAEIYGAAGTDPETAVFFTADGVKNFAGDAVVNPPARACTLDAKRVHSYGDATIWVDNSTEITLTKPCSVLCTLDNLIITRANLGFDVVAGQTVRLCEKSLPGPAIAAGVFSPQVYLRTQQEWNSGHLDICDLRAGTCDAVYCYTANYILRNAPCSMYNTVYIADVSIDLRNIKYVHGDCESVFALA